MESWKHLLVRVDSKPIPQVTLVPSIPGMDGRFTQGTQDSNVLDLLDELGRQGWQLVAVQGREFWLKKPVSKDEGDAAQAAW